MYSCYQFGPVTAPSMPSNTAVSIRRGSLQRVVPAVPVLFASKITFSRNYMRELLRFLYFVFRGASHCEWLLTLEYCFFSHPHLGN